MCVCVCVCVCGNVMHRWLLNHSAILQECAGLVWFRECDSAFHIMYHYNIQYLSTCAKSTMRMHKNITGRRA